MIDVIGKKQMHESVIMSNKNASEDWNCIILMFLMSLNVCFVFGCVCFMYICVRTAIWLFLGQGLAFLGKDRLATLSNSLITQYLLHSTLSKFMSETHSTFDVVEIKQYNKCGSPFWKNFWTKINKAKNRYCIQYYKNHSKIQKMWDITQNIGCKQRIVKASNIPQNPKSKIANEGGPLQTWTK